MQEEYRGRRPNGVSLLISMNDLHSYDVPEVVAYEARASSD